MNKTEHHVLSEVSGTTSRLSRLSSVASTHTTHDGIRIAYRLPHNPRGARLQNFPNNVNYAGQSVISQHPSGSDDVISPLLSPQAKMKVTPGKIEKVDDRKEKLKESKEEFWMRARMIKKKDK